MLGDSDSDAGSRVGFSPTLRTSLTPAERPAIQLGSDSRPKERPGLTPQDSASHAHPRRDCPLRLRPPCCSVEVPTAPSLSGSRNSGSPTPHQTTGFSRRMVKDGNQSRMKRYEGRGPNQRRLGPHAVWGHKHSGSPAWKLFKPCWDFSGDLIT